jgi:hypothetical protein
MKTINFDDFKCRCSKISAVLAVSAENKPLSDPQRQELERLENKEKLTAIQAVDLARLQTKRDAPPEITYSIGCIDYLTEWYAWYVYGKMPVDKETMEMIPTEKGKKVEAESILLLSKVDGKIYCKNEQRVSNDFLTGEPDVFEGEHIMAAKTLTDMKNSVDYPCFLKQISKPLEKSYIRQVQGYGDITGAQDLSITRAIVNMPLEIIMEYQDKIARKLGIIDRETESFQKIWEQWEQSMVFDDIPMRLRIHKTIVSPFTAEERTLLYDRVKYCREWLWKFHENYSNLNI